MTAALASTPDIEVVLPLAPVAWQRADGRMGGGRRTPDATRRFELAVSRYTRAAMRGRRPLDGPTLLLLEFVEPHGTRCPVQSVWRSTKPDVDNLTKGVMDGLEKGGAYTHDSRVALLGTAHRWAAKGEAEHVRIGLVALRRDAGPVILELADGRRLALCLAV